MFDIGPGEFALLVILGIIVVGPERLPGMLRQAMTFMRNLRTQVASAREELTSTIGPQVGEMVDMVGELNPRRLLDDPRPRVSGVGGAAAAQPAATSSPHTSAADVPEAPIIDADTP
jgi:sec-independent protein translocase protein TatB